MCFKDSTMEFLEHKKSSCKCELVDYKSLPSYLKDNEFILHYYRSEWPLKQAILSIFSIHNETLNIWTHLIGFFIFLALTMCMEMIEFGGSLTLPASSWHLPHVISDCTFQSCSESNDIYPAYSMMFPREYDIDSISSSLLQGQPITRWPLYTFMCGAMLCLFTSSVCHLLSCHSKLYSYIMLRLDYTGISVLIVTSFYPLVYYSFMCHPFYRDMYIGFITIFGIATALISLLPVFQTPKYRIVRSGLFALMGASGFVPIVHKLVVFGHQHEALVTTWYELVMGAFYVFGVVIYVARIPERWMPGKFDLAGHSHQLFHVMVIAGACTHYLGGLVYLQWREIEGCY